MASIQSVKTQIQEANALGIENLTAKGVDIPSDATTYEIMQNILNVVSDGGAEYKDITFVNGNEIQLTDDKDVVHTIAFSKDIDGSIKSITFDSKEIDIAYNDMGVTVGATDITFPETDFTEVIFYAEGETYETMYVKQGNSYEPPRTVPIGADGSYLTYWSADGETPASFPAVASGSTQVYSGMFSALIQDLYEFYGVDYNTYPYVFVFFKEGTTDSICLAFCSEYQQNMTSTSILSVNKPCYYVSYGAFSEFPETEGWQHSWDDIGATIEYVMEKVPTSQLSFYKLSTAAPTIDLNTPTRIYTNASIDKNSIETEYDTVVYYIT